MTRFIVRIALVAGLFAWLLYLFIDDLVYLLRR